MKRPWFSNLDTGRAILLPITLYGWLTRLAFITVIAMSATIHQQWAMPARIGAAIAFLGFSYYKSDKWGPLIETNHEGFPCGSVDAGPSPA